MIRLSSGDLFHFRHFRLAANNIARHRGASFRPAREILSLLASRPDGRRQMIYFTPPIGFTVDLTDSAAFRASSISAEGFLATQVAI